ncbi:MAG: S1 RNA-binding domain-containing protein [Clostridiaceae bacterium]
MIKVGDYNILRVIKEKGKGYLLKEEGIKEGEEVFLPELNTGDKELEVNDKISAFVYRDNQGKYIATLEKPIARAEELAYLKVVGLTTFGAFVDMGLDRDVLVPLKEKIYPFKKDKSYLFYVYVDKTGRLAASAYVEKHLQVDHSYKVGDEVKGSVYGFQSNNSLKVAVENRYKGVVLHNEYFTRIEYGDSLTFRVNKIYEDGRLGLTPRKAAKEELPVLEEKIIEYLKSNNGFMTFNDRTSPEEIYNVFNVSKNYFKNALGGLMKKKLIAQDEKGTRLID